MIEDLQQEIERCKKLLEVYKTIPMGVFAATMIASDIEEAEKSIAESDTVGMIRALNNLRGCN